MSQIPRLANRKIMPTAVMKRPANMCPEPPWPPFFTAVSIVIPPVGHFRDRLLCGLWNFGEWRSDAGNWLCRFLRWLVVSSGHNPNCSKDCILARVRIWRKLHPNIKLLCLRRSRTDTRSSLAMKFTGCRLVRLFASYHPANRALQKIESRGFVFSTRRQNVSERAGRRRRSEARAFEDGGERISTHVAALVDTNVLVY